MRAYTFIVPFIVLTACGGKKLSVDDLLDQSWGRPEGSAGQGTGSLGECLYETGSGFIQFKFGSDGVLTTLRVEDWYYVCGSDSDADKEEQWLDYTTYCRTLDYSFASTSVDDSATSLTRSIHLDNSAYEIDEAIIGDSDANWTATLSRAEDADSADLLLESNSSTLPLSTGDFDWSTYSCEPEDFQTTDPDSYAPELGTGEPMSGS